jgi:hypothetical protein
VVSTSIKHHNLNNTTGDNFLYSKAANKRAMIYTKQRPYDLTFTNFKQKIYEKKMNKISNQRAKYNE